MRARSVNDPQQRFAGHLPHRGIAPERSERPTKSRGAVNRFLGQISHEADSMARQVVRARAHSRQQLRATRGLKFPAAAPDVDDRHRSPLTCSATGVETIDEPAERMISLRSIIRPAGSWKQGVAVPEESMLDMRRTATCHFGSPRTQDSALRTHEGYTRKCGISGTVLFRAQ